MCSFGENDIVDQDFLELLETVFQSPASLNASYLVDSHQVIMNKISFHLKQLWPDFKI